MLRAAEAEHEVGRKAIPVAPERLEDLAGIHTVEPCQGDIEKDAMSSNHEDVEFDPFRHKGLLIDERDRDLGVGHGS